MSNFLVYAFWIGPAALQAALAAYLIHRKLHKQFPAFFLYTTYEVVAAALLFVVFHSFPKEYFYVLWACNAIEIALSFAVILEVFSQAFQPYEALRDLGRTIFRWVALFLVLVAVVLAVATHGSGDTRVVAGILALDRSLLVMQCGLVLFLVLFLPHLGLSWKHNLVGIATGFGLLASTDLIMIAARAAGGPSSVTDLTLTLAHGAAFTFVVVLWTVYMLLPEPARRPVELASQSERWDSELTGIKRPIGPEDSFLPRLEARVERVMARYNTVVTAPPQSRYWN